MIGQPTAHRLQAMQNIVNISRRVLVELLVGTKNDNGDVDRAQDRQFMGLFEEAALALEKGPARRVVSIASVRRVGRVAARSSVGWAVLVGRCGSYTERFLSSLIGLISIFLRPMAMRRRSCCRDGEVVCRALNYIIRYSFISCGCASRAVFLILERRAGAENQMRGRCGEEAARRICPSLVFFL